MNQPVDSGFVRRTFSDNEEVTHYSRSCDDIGLWASERVFFTRVWRTENAAVTEFSSDVRFWAVRKPGV
jgi:hypothetical protein